jgi:hypothetical protein
MDIIDRMRSTMTASPDNNLPPVVDGAFHNIDTNVVLSCGGCSVAQQDLKDWTTVLPMHRKGISLDLLVMRLIWAVLLARKIWE